VRRAGFQAAFAQGAGVVAPRADLWAVPRLPVGDWSLERLEDEMLWVWLRTDYRRA
jgi:hypothetical protein